MDWSLRRAKNPFLGDEIGKLVLRLAVGGLMLFHGVAKVLHPAALDGIGKQLAGLGLPAYVAYGAYIGEILAPLMILFGIFARVGGLLVAVNMGFAVMLAHRADLLSLAKHGGYALELQAFYLLCGIAIALLGSGRLMAVRSD
jgi:putative oxidoreductase